MTEPVVVADVSAARKLASHLIDPARTRPVVVVTTPAGQGRPWMDAGQVASQAGDLADVYVITDPNVSWAFSHAMPENTSVYGGAGRTYPPGRAWLADWHAAPMRQAFGAAEGRHATEQLVSDALSMAAAAGIAVTAPDSARAVTGKVKAVAAGRAIVDVDGAAMAFIAPELTLAGAEAEDLFAKGQRVAGLLNPVTHRLDVKGSLLSAAEALDAYDYEDVVLTRVHEVSEDRVQLTLYPHVTDTAVIVEVSRDMVTGNPLDDLRDLMAVGDVVGARVIGTAPHWALVLLDIDDDELVVPAPPLLRGGPPWLVEPVLVAPDVAPASGPDTRGESLPAAEEDPAVAEEAAQQGRKLTQNLLLAIEGKKAEVADLLAQVRVLGERLEYAERDRDTFRRRVMDAEAESRRSADEVAKARAQLRKVRTSSVASVPPPEFADREAGFRYLVLTAWARRTPLGEQPSRPLLNFAIGPRFLDSLADLQGISKEKVAEVVFEIVTDVAKDLTGRAVHHLREGQGPTVDAVVRGDGAVCMRASLQVNTPAARRIHYWVGPGNAIELSRVTVHDDFNP